MPPQSKKYHLTSYNFLLMKNASSVLSILAFVGVLILLGFQFAGKKKSSASSDPGSQKKEGATMRIAYVDIDSFESNYDYLKTKKEEFTKKQAEMQKELERSARQYQNNVEAFQRKIKSGNISQSEGEATERQLIQMQQSLQLREQALTEQLLKEKDAFNEKLHDELNGFLETYNREKGYDFILSYSELSSLILYANEKYNITQDVINGMNEKAKKMADTTQKK